MTIKEIADKFFEEQEKLNVSYDSREAFIEGFKLAKAIDKEKVIEFAISCLRENDYYFDIEQHYNETFKSK